MENLSDIKPENYIDMDLRNLTNDEIGSIITWYQAGEAKPFLGEVLMQRVCLLKVLRLYPDLAPDIEIEEEYWSLPTS